MKKLLFLFAVLLSGCGCVIGQIPPQVIYAPPTGCQALLPDYRTILKITDNCEIIAVTQNPGTNYILNAQNKTTIVTIRATDASGNFREVRFTVELRDTIKPQIALDTTLFGYNAAKFTQLYDLADGYVAMAINPDGSYQKDWLFVASRQDSLGFRERIITYRPDSLLYRFPDN